MNGATKTPPSAAAGINPATVPQHVMASVRGKLAEIEREHGVRVLYAAESGSRAWGFPSKDSDYDVRFIYLHELDWYVSLGENRDVIERPIDDASLDISGWDFRKALRLLLKSNPPLYEWLDSPICYRGMGNDIAASMRDLAERFYSLRAMGHHYLSMIWSNEKSYFVDRTEVRLKKYFYSIRPLCALFWLREREELPPMSLGPLMDGIMLQDTVREAICELLETKRRATELGVGPRAPELDRWIADGVAEAQVFCAGLPEGDSMVAAADALYRKVVLGRMT